MKKIIETDRLYLREMVESDVDDLAKILKDENTMYAYAHGFSDEEVREWLLRQLKCYKEYGFGLWAVILKETEEFIGQAGLLMQSYNENNVVEIGYLLNKDFWHKGIATEASVACKNYAFDVLRKREVYSFIRDNNISSINVAKRNGMVKVGEIVKHYYGMDMIHYVFCVKNS